MKNQCHTAVRFLDDLDGVTYNRLIKVLASLYPDDFVGQEWRTQCIINNISEEVLLAMLW